MQNNFILFAAAVFVTVTALSLIATAKGVGGAVIIFAAGLVSDAFGLRAVYLMLSAAALVCLALTAAIRLPEEGERLF